MTNFYIFWYWIKDRTVKLINNIGVFTKCIIAIGTLYLVMLGFYFLVMGVINDSWYYIVGGVCIILCSLFVNLQIN